MHSISILGLDLDSAKRIGMGVAGGFTAMSIVSAIVVRKVITKLILAIALLAVALAVWSQRANLEDCASRARESATAGSTSVTCTFFGYDVSVP